jgi:chorismate dehydratase
MEVSGVNSMIYFYLLSKIYLCPPIKGSRKTNLIQLKKIKVGIVNYLNTRPLLYGLERPPIADQIELVGDYPSRLAEMLKNEQIDVGLIPVAVIPELKEFHIVGDYCIGTEGEIASVALFSEVPMREIKKVYLDYQSRTSVELLKFLIREYWGINPEIIKATGEDYRSRIKGNVAGLVIGDRAFEQRKVSTFIYDLGSEWRALTGLPFVFAAWISTKRLDPEFIELFNQANAEGLAHIDEIVSANPFELFDLEKYYKLHLSYRLDENKLKGMKKYLQVINTK